MNGNQTFKTSFSVAVCEYVPVRWRNNMKHLSLAVVADMLTHFSNFSPQFPEDEAWNTMYQHVKDVFWSRCVFSTDCTKSFVQEWGITHDGGDQYHMTLPDSDGQPVTYHSPNIPALVSKFTDVVVIFQISLFGDMIDYIPECEEVMGRYNDLDSKGNIKWKDDSTLVDFACNPRGTSLQANVPDHQIEDAAQELQDFHKMDIATPFDSAHSTTTNNDAARESFYQQLIAHRNQVGADVNSGNVVADQGSQMSGDSHNNLTNPDQPRILLLLLLLLILLL